MKLFEKKDKVIPKLSDEEKARAFAELVAKDYGKTIEKLSRN